MLGTLVTALHRIDPRQNLWVTWANQTGQDAFCLSLASATEPFRTCLVGVPGFDESHFKGFTNETVNCTSTVSKCTRQLIEKLIVSLSWDPQELNLLGSMRIGNSSQNWTQTCIGFGGPGLKGIYEHKRLNWTG